MTTAADAPTRYRLPTAVRPHHYDLHLEVDLDAAAFTGTAVARVEVAEPVGEVVLNAVELDIEAAWVRDGAGRRIEANVSLDADTERATLTLASAAARRPAEVHLRFTGALNDKLVGFYRTTFNDHEGQTRVARVHPVRGDPRPPGLPLLGRARLQGHVLGDAGRARRPAGHLQRPGGRPPAHRRRPDAVPLRRHDGHVHLPGGLRGRPLRGHRRRSTSTARRCGSCTPSARATSPASGWRPAGSGSSTSPPTTASPTRGTSSTWSPCPTSPSGPWRTWAASRSGRCCCWSTRPPPPSPSCSGWPT